MKKSDLEKLIEEVVKEDLSIKLVDTDGDGNPDQTFTFPDTSPSNWDATQKTNSKAVFGTKNPKGYKELAALSADDANDVLSVNDLEAAYKMSPAVRLPDKKAARELANRMKKPAFSGDAAYNRVAQDTWAKATQFDTDPNADARVTADYQQVTKPKSTGLGITNRDLEPFDIDMDDKETTAPGDLPAHDNLDADTVGAEDKKNIWKKGSSLGVQIEAERSTVAIFRSIPGKNVIEKFKNLSEFANALQEPKKFEKWSDKHNEFDLVNYSTVLANLGDFGKHYTGSAAGFEFEKFLAFFVNLPVVGGSGGAADNIGKVVNELLTGGDTVFYSAKLYSDFAPSQSLGKAEAGDDDSKGIRYICETLGEPIYYIIGLKTGTDWKTKGAEAKEPEGKYNHVNIFIVKIEYNEDLKDNNVYKREKVKGYTFSVLDSEGKETKKFPTFGTDSNKSLLLMGRTAQQRLVAKDPTFVMPVLKLGANPDELTTLSANYVQQKITDYTQNLASTIVTIYKRLKNLEFNTREYSAVKGKNSGNLGGMAHAAKDYLDAVQVDYSALNTEYTTMFKAGGELSGEEKKQLKKESKSRLDQLIEAIAKQTLLK